MTRTILLDQNGSGRAFLALLDMLMGAKDKVVPQAGIEPALLSEPHFECGASTNSAIGAREGNEEGLYHGLKYPRKGEPSAPFGFPMGSMLLLSEEDLEALLAVEQGQEKTRPHYTQTEQVSLMADSERAGVPKDKMHFVEMLEELFYEIDLPNNWDLHFVYDTRGYFYFQVADHEGVCNVTGQPDPWKGRKWLISEHMTKGEILQTILKAVLTAAEHEIREQLTYRGQAIFDPHYNIDKLVELRAAKSAQAYR